MDSSPPPLPPSSQPAYWWKAWVAAVVGTPVAAIAPALVLGNSKTGDLFALWLVVVLFAGVCVHVWVCTKLAKCLVEARDPSKRGGGSGGLTVALILGGWGAMFAVFFCGCLAAVIAG